MKKKMNKTNKTNKTNPTKQGIDLAGMGVNKNIVIDSLLLNVNKYMTKISKEAEKSNDTKLVKNIKKNIANIRRNIIRFRVIINLLDDIYYREDMAESVVIKQPDTGIKDTLLNIISIEK